MFCTKRIFEIVEVNKTKIGQLDTKTLEQYRFAQTVLTSRFKNEKLRNSQDVLAELATYFTDLRLAEYKLNTSIICVQLPELFNSKPMEVFALDELENRVCKLCGYYQSYLSAVNEKSKHWICESCSRSTKFNRPLSKITKHDIEYRPKRNLNEKAAPPKLYIFCIDISHSMDDNNKLNIVKNACYKALDDLLENEPYCKVALVLFNNEGHTYEYVIDASHSNMKKIKMNLMPTKTMITRAHFESNDFDMNKMKDCVYKMPPLNDVHSLLKKTIDSIRSSGFTIIGDALVYSVVLASTMEKSTIILVTDGESHEKTQADKSESFFNKVIHYANQHSTSIYTIRMDDCDLQHFENLSRKTGGEIGLLDNNKRPNFNWMLAKARVKAEISKYDTMTIMSNDSLISLKCLYERDVINKSGESNKIDLKEFGNHVCREFYVEISPSNREKNNAFYLSGVTTALQTLFIQVQLKSKNSHRIFTMPLTLKSMPKLSSTPAYTYLAFKGEGLNHQFTNINAWRYIAFYILEKKEFAKARQFFAINIKHFDLEFMEDIELKKSLFQVMIKLEEGFGKSNLENKPIAVDDRAALFLSNILSDTSFIDGVPFEAARMEPTHTKPDWVPAGYTYAGLPFSKHGEKAAASDQRTWSTNVPASLMMQNKAMVGLPAINPKLTSRESQRPNQTFHELPRIEGSKAPLNNQKPSIRQPR